MRIDLIRLVKLGLFFCLALTAYKGVVKLPEIQPVLQPARFFNGLRNDAENSLIMKERHFDFNYQTGKALELRLREMESRGQFPPADVLVDRDRLTLAIRKTLAKDSRNADYVLLAEEKLARARRFEAEGWTMGWACWPPAEAKAAPAGPAPGHDGPGEPGSARP